MKNRPSSARSRAGIEHFEVEAQVPGPPQADSARGRDGAAAVPERPADDSKHAAPDVGHHDLRDGRAHPGQRDRHGPKAPASGSRRSRAVGAALAAVAELAPGRPDRHARHLRALAPARVRGLLAVEITATTDWPTGRGRRHPRTDRHMHAANPHWGAPRIHGELQKLGLTVSQSLEAVLTAPRSPWQNPFVERVSGSLATTCRTTPATPARPSQLFTRLGRESSGRKRVQVWRRPARQGGALPRGGGQPGGLARTAEAVRHTRVGGAPRRWVGRRRFLRRAFPATRAERRARTAAASFHTSAPAMSNSVEFRPPKCRERRSPIAVDEFVVKSLNTQRLQVFFFVMAQFRVHCSMVFRTWRRIWSRGRLAF